MDLSHYELWARHLVKYASLEELKDGLFEECGEVAGKFKRLARGDYDEREEDEQVFRSHVIAELGDVLFYLTVIAGRMGVGLQEVANRNHDKLERRRVEGKLRGEGDVR